MRSPGWLPNVLPGPAAIAAPVIVAALIILAACGGEQVGTTAKPSAAPRPTATATPYRAVEPTRTPSLTGVPTATTPVQSPASTNPPARDTAATPGQRIFQANCAVCHGVDGAGQPYWHIQKADGLLPPPPLNGDGHTWHHGDGTLYTYVSQGGAAFEFTGPNSFKSGMPAFGEVLSHDEIVAVIEYVKSLWVDKIAQGLGLVKRESQALVSENDPYPEP